MLKYLTFGAIAALSFASQAQALCTSYPNTLTNGTTADGGQVMANFNCAALTSGATLNGVTFTGTTTFPGSTTISAAGLVGIGMAPSNVLDISQSQNGSSSIWITNNNTGAGAQARVVASNGTNTTTVGNFGQNYGSSGIYQAGSGYVEASSSLTLDGYAGPLVFATLHTEQGRFGTDGSFLVGTTTNGGWAGTSRLEVQAASGQAVSALQTGTGSAILARVNSGSSYLLNYYLGSSPMGQVTPASSDMHYLSTNMTVIQAGGSGGVQLASGATSWSAVSDERMKRWDIPQQNYRSAIEGLWIGDYNLYQSTAKIGPAKTRFGLRAQQAYITLPANLRDMAIHKGDADKPWTVSSEPLAFLALWGVQDLYKLEKEQVAEVAELKEALKATRRVNDLQMQEIRRLNAALLADHKASNLVKPQSINLARGDH